MGGREKRCGGFVVGGRGKGCGGFVVGREREKVRWSCWLVILLKAPIPLSSDKNFHMKAAGALPLLTRYPHLE